MTEQPYVEPSHRLPDGDWGQVVKRAREIREQDAMEGALEPDADLLALAAQDPDPSLFPDADGDGIPDDQDRFPGYSMLDEHHGEDD